MQKKLARRVGRRANSVNQFFYLDFFGENLFFQYLELIAGQDTGIGIFADLHFVLKNADCRTARAFTA
jgi:hypothetical protein